MVDDRLGLRLGLDQDVAGAILLAARRFNHLVVLGLDIGIGDRIGLERVADQGSDQDVLAGAFELALGFGIARQALAFGFLDEDLAGDQFIAHRVAQVGGIGATLLGQ